MKKYSRTIWFRNGNFSRSRGPTNRCQQWWRQAHTAATFLEADQPSFGYTAFGKAYDKSCMRGSTVWSELGPSQSRILAAQQPESILCPYALGNDDTMQWPWKSGVDVVQYMGVHLFCPQFSLTHHHRIMDAAYSKGLTSAHCDQNANNGFHLRKPVVVHYGATANALVWSHKFSGVQFHTAFCLPTLWNCPTRRQPSAFCTSMWSVCLLWISCLHQVCRRCWRVMQPVTSPRDHRWITRYQYHSQMTTHVCMPGAMSDQQTISCQHFCHAHTCILSTNPPDYHRS